MPVQVTAFSLFDWIGDDEDHRDVLLHLFQGEIEADTSPLLTDFVQADFPGYKPKVLTIRDDGRELRRGYARVSFLAETWSFEGDGAEENSLGGFYLTLRELNLTESLLAWQAFHAAKHVMNATNPFGLLVQVMAQKRIL